MKKTIIWVVIGIAVFGIGMGAAFTLLTDTESVVTLDINPSIELVVSKWDKIKNYKALNDDAKLVLSEDILKKPLTDAIDMIAKKTIERGFAEEDKITILLDVDGVLKIAVVRDDLKKSYEKLQKTVNVVVPVINDEARKKAEEYKITPAKAAYIESIVSTNAELKFEDLVDKSTVELNNMKETGLYCDPGYTLEGEFCKKKSTEKEAVTGYVCPEGYEEKDKKCYMATAWEGEYYCETGMTLEDKKCTGEVKTDAKAKCTTGTYNSKSGKCELLTYVGAGTKKCREADDLLLDNGKCAQHHMGKSFDDPNAVIDPATECCCGDTYKNGFCYSLPNGNYDATVTCPTGSSYATGDKGKACYSSESSDATFYCEGNATLTDKKCTENKTVDAKVKKACTADYKLFEDRICLNYDETTDYVSGLSCEDKDAQLEDDKCVLYEIVDAKGKNEEVTEN